MATVSYFNDSTAAPTSLPVEPRPATLKVEASSVSRMNDDDAAALRIVSAIIFAVVAAGTLLMLGTVLVCS
jgi:hypothetical protein